MSAKTKSVLKRLAKGFISGAVASMSVIAIASPANFAEVGILLRALALAGIGGGISGLILALNKWASWKA